MVERSPILTAICHLILIGGIVLVCLPLYFAFVAGSLTMEEVQQVPMPLLPGGHFFENLATAWVKVNFNQLMINSFIVAVGITVGKVAISLLSAFAITYFRFRFRLLAFWLIFMSLMLPVEVRIVPTYEAVANAALPIQWIIDAMHLSALWEWISGKRIEISLEWNMLNTYQGLILPLIASASATFLFRQFFLTVPDDLLEAARLDGASAMRFFWTILLPLSRSNIIALSIILFLYGWNQYLWPLLFTTDMDMATAVIGVKHLIPRSDTEPTWNLAMSGALLTMLPPVLVVLVMQRWFVRGLVDSSK
jgi:sn-glycerol 3-phosphate transport system permease protein